MATALGLPYSPPSPLDFSYADTNSSIFPDRPIRPLPKRRLRSRVSPEVADSILYSSEGGSPGPLLQSPNESQNHTIETSPNAQSTSRSSPAAVKESSNEPGRDSYHFKGNDGISDDEDSIALLKRYHDARQQMGLANSAFSRLHNSYQRNVRPAKPPIAQSTTSSVDSVDGYDSFENTNNKKKRKVPMSGSLGGHQSSLSSEMAQMGISSTRGGESGVHDVDSGVGHYYGTGSSATPASTSAGNGISGPGRGRYGKTGVRHAITRTPLGLSTNGSNTLAAGRLMHPRVARHPVGTKDSSGTPNHDQGIISAAIANAAAMPSTPIRGQENVSLLEQQSLKSSSSAKEQFTFTCESESAKGMIWPENPSPSPGRSYNEDGHHRTSRKTQSGKEFTTQATQTNPGLPGQHGQTSHPPPDVNQQPQQQQRKPRRPLSKQYAIEARQRRLRQADNNYYHPPKEEDIWICEFCEYEAIFGSPPKALIRQYEAKDLRERKRLAEKRRLLEKAKMKGRKGKKGSKNANKQTTAQAPQGTQKERYEPSSGDPQQTPDYGAQDEEYTQDDYEEDDATVPNEPLHPPTKNVHSVSQKQNHTSRLPSGTVSQSDQRVHV